jgi:hypothetical protein
MSWSFGTLCPSATSLNARAGLSTQCTISGCGNFQSLKSEPLHLGHM